MFSRVVGFRRSARLRGEIIHFYPWGKQKQSAWFRTEAVRVAVEWWNRPFGRLRREVCLIVSPGVMSNPGTRRNGSSIKIRLTGKKKQRDRKNAYCAPFHWSSSVSFDWFIICELSEAPRSVFKLLESVCPNIRFLCGQHSSASVSLLAHMLTKEDEQNRVPRVSLLAPPISRLSRGGSVHPTAVFRNFVSCLSRSASLS